MLSLFSNRLRCRNKVCLKAMVFGEARYDLAGKRVQSLSEDHRLRTRRGVLQIDQQFDAAIKTTCYLYN
ncbi:hypothetical protein DP804_23260 [Salmonella enterica subsp. enterica]|nr:hypothetical protein [Salmonella enterica subsp. enterica serovar Virchow]